MSKKPILLVVWLVLLAGLLFGITHLGAVNGTGGEDTGKGGSPPVPVPITPQQWPQILAHAAAPPRGDANARYTVAEFGDFQCPQCGRIPPLLDPVLQKYPKQVSLIFVHRPFPNMHRWALSTAEAAQIAAAQGKFWPMYDVLYSHQKDLEKLVPSASHKDLPPGVLSQYAVEAGLDKAQFEAALASHSMRAVVDAASKFSDSIHVDVTPTLLVHDNVNGTVTTYTGLQPKDISASIPGALFFDRDFLNRLPWLPAANAH